MLYWTLYNIELRPIIMTKHLDFSQKNVSHTGLEQQYFFPDHLASQPELLYKSNQSKDSNLTACSFNVFLRILHMSALRFSLIINHLSHLCALILNNHFVGKMLLPDCCLICLQQDNRFTFRPCQRQISTDCKHLVQPQHLHT